VQAQRPTPGLSFSYRRIRGALIKDTRHGRQVLFEPGQQRVVLDGRTASLIQFHFHSPAEHVLTERGGEREAMEAHLVHRADDGTICVVAALMHAVPVAADNPALAYALQSGPSDGGEEMVGSGAVYPQDLLPSRRAYLAYDGSLTTPPCSETVAWYVWETPLTVPASQVLKWQRAVGEQKTLRLNARALQPLNGRSVRRCYQ